MLPELKDLSMIVPKCFSNSSCRFAGHRLDVDATDKTESEAEALEAPRVRYGRDD